jgi:hypothetical protein
MEVSVVSGTEALGGPTHGQLVVRGARREAEDDAMDEGDGEGQDALQVEVEPMAVCVDVKHHVEDCSIADQAGVKPKDAQDRVCFLLGVECRRVYVHCPSRPRALFSLFKGDFGEHVWQAGVGPGEGQGQGHGQETAPAFHWAQFLAGMGSFSAVYAKELKGFSHGVILDRLRARLRGHLILDKLLERLKRKAEPVPADAKLEAVFFPSTEAPSGGGKGWQVGSVREDDALGHVFRGPEPQEGEQPQTSRADMLALSVARGARYLEVEFRKDGAGRKGDALRVYVEVPPEYPLERQPRMVLDSSSGSTNGHLVASLNAEVNDGALQLVEDSVAGMDWLLPHQIRKVKSMLNRADAGSASGERKGKRSRERAPLTPNLYAKYVLT